MNIRQLAQLLVLIAAGSALISSSILVHFQCYSFAIFTFGLFLWLLIAAARD